MAARRIEHVFDRLAGDAAGAGGVPDSRTVMSGCPTELAERVEAAQRIMNAAAAVQVQRIAQYAAREDVPNEDGTWGQQDRGVGHVAAFASGVVGPAGSARGRGRQGGCCGEDGVGHGPTLHAMAAGDLDEWRASVLTRELATPARNGRGGPGGGAAWCAGADGRADQSPCPGAGRPTRQP